MGSLPAIIGVVALVVIFGIMEGETFLSKGNFANLINQGAAIMVLAMGLVFVLLLGEIDLSAGFAAGMGAAILATTLTEKGWAWPVALLAALATGVAIGFAIALLVARLGIPSFVVTLAFFLGLQGAMLLIIGEGGTIPIRDDAILSVMNDNMPVVLGWLFGLIVIAGFALATLMRIRARKSEGLPTEAMSVWAVKVGALAAVVLIAVWLLNQERQRQTAIITIQGIPWVVPLVAALVVGLAFVLSRTAFGRHIYAVGGNAEAARRAGINVPNIKSACFVICTTLAIVAGILIASRDNSVSPTTGGAQTLLYAVGAAVIGGTSLFGGRGRVYDAVTGGLVVAVIANGLPLVTQKSGTQFIVNGVVLLVAASVDAISRRRAAATGR
jgi:D-xylose transport system permease protein